MARLEGGQGQPGPTKCLCTGLGKRRHLTRLKAQGSGRRALSSWEEWKPKTGILNEL